jgi:uncharacterized protein
MKKDGNIMVIGAAQIRMHANWVHTLKEKRMVVKSICAKVQNKYNVSIAEVDEQDIHQIIVLGIAAIGGDRAQADSITDHVVNFIESNFEGEIVGIEREVL